MRSVTIDPDGTNGVYLGVIIQFPTGVMYEQQCAGTRCEQRAIEGYFVPLGGARFEVDKGRIASAELHGVFHSGDGCLGVLVPERLAQLRLAVEAITYWTSTNQRHFLQLDEGKIDQVVEAWIPVLTPDGFGVLTWPNCD